jgi:hypothetical protein
MTRGTAAGKKFGVAKEANIYAVKVLSDRGYVHAQQFFPGSCELTDEPIPSSGATSDMYVYHCLHIAFGLGES